jgi:PAS domain S-box-containing protein
MDDETRTAEQDRRHLRAILDTAPECIKLIAPDGRLIDMNPAGLAMIDAASLDEVRDADIAAFVVPEHRERFREMLARVIAGERCGLAFEVVGLHGRRLWMDSQGAPLWNDDTGRGVEAALFVTRDVTQRVAAEQERRALQQQLLQSQKMEAVGRLAGGIAHDFNNLLTVIQGQISLITATTAIDPDLAAGLRTVTEAAERAASLTRQLLTFSRRQVKQARHLDLALLVTNLAALLRRVLGEDVLLETRVAADDLFVHADPTMIEQVILNLAVNARDAMPFGGRLTLALDRAGTHVRLTVSDTGSGISVDHLPHVFEPFFTTKDVGRGSGLGLATVFGIVEQHDGSIDVESAVGHGTTFRVRLPAAARPAPEAARPARRVPLVGGRETVLVVEDEQPVRELARAILQRFGYTVLDADSGEAALLRFEQAGGQVDLLLTDLVMPGSVSGGALADRLRLERPALRVIYMSGHASDVVQRRLGGEPDRFLQKPFELSTLVRVVRQALDEPANITT